MLIRHGELKSRWDQFWNQRVHLRVLLVITNADFAQ